MLDGNEVGSNETILYIYGPDADGLFSGIEPVLLTNPFCQNARIIVRYGGSGDRTKEERIPIRVETPG